jgi:hypothetical protein
MLSREIVKNDSVACVCCLSGIALLITTDAKSEVCVELLCLTSTEGLEMVAEVKGIVVASLDGGACM